MSRISDIDEIVSGIAGVAGWRVDRNNGSAGHGARPGRTEGRGARTELLLWRLPGSEESFASDLQGAGHRADRSVRLRQVHAVALLQPDSRPVSGQPL